MKKKIYLVVTFLITVFCAITGPPRGHSVREIPVYSLHPDSSMFVIECLRTEQGPIYGVGIMSEDGEIKRKWLPEGTEIKEIPDTDKPRYLESGNKKILYIRTSTFINNYDDKESDFSPIRSYSDYRFVASERRRAENRES